MTESLCVGFIVPFLYRIQRGIERSCVQLANALAAMGHQVTLMTWEEPERKTAFHINLDVRVATVPYIPYYRKYWAVPFYSRELMIQKYDVVNIYFAGYGEAQALSFARRWRSFQVNFIAGYPIEQVPHRFEEFRQYGLAQSLDHIIVKSPPMAADIARFFGRDVEVIPNGVDVNAFDPDRKDIGSLRQRLDFRDEDHVLLTVAALEQRKGVQHVIRVLPDLLQTGLSVRYVVIGDGPYRETLESLAVECDVAERVHFVGTIADVHPYYMLADVFLLLSYGEGLPNVLLEAWAMRLPVIVSRHAPYPDVVPKDIGFLVDGKDSNALEDILIHLLSSDEERKQIGYMARHYVEENYAWSLIAKQYLEVWTCR